MDGFLQYLLVLFVVDQLAHVLRHDAVIVVRKQLDDLGEWDERGFGILRKPNNLSRANGSLCTARIPVPQERDRLLASSLLFSASRRSGRYGSSTDPKRSSSVSLASAASRTRESSPSSASLAITCGIVRPGGGSLFAVDVRSHRCGLRHRRKRRARGFKSCSSQVLSRRRSISLTHRGARIELSTRIPVCRFHRSWEQSVAVRLAVYADGEPRISKGTSSYAKPIFPFPVTPR